jgi:hypothetical protein
MLSLFFCTSGVKGAASLGKLLKGDCSLRILDVQGCAFGGLGAKWLVKAVRSNKSLSTLSLASNNIGLSGTH